jgi:riboflavin transporter FmnP
MEKTIAKKVTESKKQGRASSLGRVHTLTGTAMLSAAATVLMFLDFSVPFMPGFIKLDISELPALLAGFAYGPVSGVLVCLIKNLINLTRSGTGGVGEFCNFLLGVCFVVPAALLYHRRKSRRHAVIGAAVGAAAMAVLSVPVNYFIVYPIYANFMPMEAIVSAYQAIFPGVNGLLQCLVVFNLPFTLVKGVLDGTVCFLIYKPLSPILHGRHH